MNYAEEIRRLAEEKGALILVHNYESAEVQDVADICGDSLELARKAKEADAKTLVICGVYFMAETAKILSPEKTVLIPRPDAGCALADQLTPEMVREAKAKHPGAPFVVYVNSSAATKAECDITCTSANAADVVRSLKEDVVLFGPDANLAAWVRKNVPEKTIITVPEDGGCPVHHKVTVEEIEAARKQFPNATVICHPECSPAVQEASDMIGSTGYMIRNCGEEKEWIIVTENGILHPLSKHYPETVFHGIEAVCESMKLITLKDLYETLAESKNEVIVEKEIADRARNAIERMIEASA
ncbi:MAG TPA: quinolinate synthase NadA [Methanocorpusculum sp.]|nr:quinolinate synthase NadA [Methanocorpusculum sp.]HJJ88390.1 quinolinate synthase NadA [Methanocorpusculum sp.]